MGKKNLVALFNLVPFSWPNQHKEKSNFAITQKETCRLMNFLTNSIFHIIPIKTVTYGLSHCNFCSKIEKKNQGRNVHYLGTIHK